MTDPRFRAMTGALSALLMSLAAMAADAAPAALTAQFQAFKIGSHSAVALKDGSLEEPVDGKSFIVGQTNEAVGAVLKAGGAPADHFELSIQPLLVHADDRVLLFDTGAGVLFGDIASTSDSVVSGTVFRARNIRAFGQSHHAKGATQGGVLENASAVHTYSCHSGTISMGPVRGPILVFGDYWRVGCSVLVSWGKRRKMAGALLPHGHRAHAPH